MWITDATQHCVTDFSSHWQRTADTEVDFGALGRRRPLELLRAVRDCADHERRDALAFGLITLAKDGHAAADQLLLMAMLPRVVTLTRSSRSLRALPLRDAQAIALGAMWEAIRVHPERQTRAVLHRLGMDAFGIVSKSAHDRHTSPEWATDPDVVRQLREEAQQPDSETLDDLATLLRWGLDASVITREDIRVIAATDLGEPGDRERLAGELGISPEALTRRAHRIRRRLKAGVGREIEVLGRW